MWRLASIACWIGLAALTACPALAQRGRRSSGWPGNGGAVVGRPSAAFQPAPRIFQPAPRIYPRQPGVSEPALRTRSMGEVGFRRSYQPEHNMRVDSLHQRGRTGHDRRAHGGNGWNRGAYQRPYFYSYSTTFVPGLLNYPFDIGSYGGYAYGGYPYGGYPYGGYPYGGYPYYGLGSFPQEDDYDSFFNQQPAGDESDVSAGQPGDTPYAAAPNAYREPYYGPPSGFEPRQQPAPPPASPPQSEAASQPAAGVDIEPQPATTLIFKDGRPSRKIYNYVITSNVIYSFHENRREEIPVASINVPATEAANRAEGVDFALPSAAR